MPAPDIINRDPAGMSDAERESEGIGELPVSLDIALDAFMTDRSASGWFTPTMLEAYEAIKRVEASYAAEMSAAELCGRYGRAY